MGEPLERQDTDKSINLKDPALAAFLAWLMPGLGHLYQRRLGKAGLFFVCIMGTFLYGLYLGSDTEPKQADDVDLGWGRVVYFSWRKNDRRLPYLCQVGIGLPALPALVQAWTGQGERPLLGNFMAPPPLVGRRTEGGIEVDEFGRPTLSSLHKQLHRYFELGTVYTMIAGLLNILAVYDAWGGPVFTETTKGKDEEEKDEKDGASPDDSS